MKSLGSGVLGWFLGSLLTLGCATPTRAPAAPPGSASSQVFALWPEGVPGDLPDAPAEHVVDGRIFNVKVPTLTMYRPASANGTAVIICPGGGYARLAIEKEGREVTRWLNSIGVTAFVLKYRVEPFRYPAALRDALRAVRLVRAHAADWGVNPQRIGIFGASAGGHLAISAAEFFDSAEGKTGAPLDAVDARPNFLGVLYPVVSMRDPFAHAGSRRSLLGDTPSQDLILATSLELHASERVPPTFIVHGNEDASVPVENSFLLQRALTAAHVPVELLVYERGPHGFGLKPGLGTASAWPARCAEWLREHGFLAAK